jgi:hypothetical protein
VLRGLQYSTVFSVPVPPALDLGKMGVEAGPSRGRKDTSVVVCMQGLGLLGDSG